MVEQRAWEVRQEWERAKMLTQQALASWLARRGDYGLLRVARRQDYELEQRLSALLAEAGRTRMRIIETKGQGT